jgi:hypothetical protein
VSPVNLIAVVLEGTFVIANKASHCTANTLRPTAEHGQLMTDEVH